MTVAVEAALPDPEAPVPVAADARMEAAEPVMDMLADAE